MNNELCRTAPLKSGLQNKDPLTSITCLCVLLLVHTRGHVREKVDKNHVLEEDVQTRRKQVPVKFLPHGQALDWVVLAHKILLKCS